MGALINAYKSAAIYNTAMTLFCCPICAGILVRSGQTLKCEASHSYDVAREGYVNLLLSHHRRSGNAGDDGHMIAARGRFLRAGHYDDLVAAIVSTVTTMTVQFADFEKKARLVDLGCGEGFFTDKIKSEVTYGVDISKPAIKAASKSYDSICFAVANTSRLPFMDNTFDVASVVLAPFFSDIVRITKPGGLLIRVSPGRDHLVELKRVIYKDLKRHKRASTSLPKLHHVNEQEVRFEMSLGATDRSDLISMTPMQHRTNKTQRGRSVEAGHHAITANFWIDVFRKTS